MVLSDIDIERERELGRLVIEPFERRLLQPAGYSLRLGEKILIPDKGQEIDLLDGGKLSHREVNLVESGHLLNPGDVVLAHTLEKLSLPLDLLGRVDGRSSMARIFLLPHQAAMNIWPGHGTKDGHPHPRAITLEVSNVGPYRIRLRPGVEIANFVVERLESPASVPYDRSGRYQADDGACVPVLSGAR